MTKFSLEIEFPEGKTPEDMSHKVREIMRFIVGSGRYNVNWGKGGNVIMEDATVAKIVWTES